MAASQLIGLCGHPDVIENVLATFYNNPDAFDWFARSGSMFMIVDDADALNRLRERGGVMVAIVTNNIPADRRKLAEYADRTISTAYTYHLLFARTVHEIIYGRPAVNKDDPRQYRPL